MGQTKRTMSKKPAYKNKKNTAPRAANTKPWGAKSAAAAKEGKKATKYYPAEDQKVELGNHHNTTKLTKLRKNIVPGSVLILLAGHFKGQRVVFLKQLESGLLLVTGPYALNGVPLRRVPQSYVIGTSTTVDISSVKVPAEVNDTFFKKPKSAKKKNDETFFNDKESDKTLDESRKKVQADVDDKLVAQVSKDALLKASLSPKFSLKNGDKPHEMNF